MRRYNQENLHPNHRVVHAMAYTVGLLHKPQPIFETPYRQPEATIERNVDSASAMAQLERHFHKHQTGGFIVSVYEKKNTTTLVAYIVNSHGKFSKFCYSEFDDEGRKMFRVTDIYKRKNDDVRFPSLVAGDADLFSNIQTANKFCCLSQPETSASKDLVMTSKVT